MDQMELYLRPTPRIDCDNDSIQETAHNLTEGLYEVTDRAKSLFYFVRDQFKYIPYVSYDFFKNYRASNTLQKGTGFCVEKATLLIALARAVNIPGRLHLVDIRNHLIPGHLIERMGTNLFSNHGYSELYLHGRWIKATPAFDLKMCQENRIIPVEFDGTNDALFHPYNLDGLLHIEYINDYGCYDDVPVEEIINAWIEVYGTDLLEDWKV